MSEHVSMDIVEAFHRTATLRRSDVFPDDALTPLTAIDDAATAAPGWVGTSWSGGTLLIGINPGGGGDNYRRNPTDDRLYEAARDFRNAETDPEKLAAFAALSANWLDIQRTHSIWRIIQPIMTATGESPKQIAFMNILPFRTRMDALPSRSVLSTAWEKAAKLQIRSLEPVRIIALGKKAWNVLSRFDVPGNPEVILFKRGIGDSYIPPESQEVLAHLASRVAKRL